MDIQTLYERYRQYPQITTDSRKCEPGSLFFALKGENFNGNAFARQAIESGCAYAIVDDPAVAVHDRIILVENVLTTLQQLAAYHRSTLRIPIIGITGTNGKTTTKELTAATLGAQFRVLYTEGNLNNHIGVPLTLLKIDASSHDFAVIEMGANHPGEIKMLTDIVAPDYGMITNVGKAHLAGFGSFEGVIRTKCELYDALRHRRGHLFIHHENPYLQPYSSGIEKTEYGTSDGLFVSGKLTANSPLLSFRFTCKGETTDVQTQLVGNYNLDNALAATAVAAYFGVSNRAIASALANYRPQNKRSQLQQTLRNRLILDAYNANPSSMTAAIENFAQMDGSPKAVILGDMLELGRDSQIEHKKIVDLLKEKRFDRVILTGPEFNRVAGNFTAYRDTDQLVNELNNAPLSGYHILIKGSRGMQLEKCIPFL